MNHFEDVGAYLLGALEPAEHEAFERALESDELLRAEVERLRFAVDVLPASPEQFEPPAGLKDRIMAVVEAEAELLNAATRPEPRRARRAPQWRLQWRPALALAATLILLVGGTTAVLLRDDSGTVVTAEVGDAKLISKGDREHATLVVEDLEPPGFRRVYQVWLQHEGQAPVPTNAIFSTSHDGTASVDVPGSLDDVEAVLVTEEPEGGSQEPTTAPVIVARPA